MSELEPSEDQATRVLIMQKYELFLQSTVKFNLKRTTGPSLVFTK